MAGSAARCLVLPRDALMGAAEPFDYVSMRCWTREQSAERLDHHVEDEAGDDDHVEREDGCHRADRRAAASSGEGASAALGGELGHMGDDQPAKLLARRSGPAIRRTVARGFRTGISAHQALWSPESRHRARPSSPVALYDPLRETDGGWTARRRDRPAEISCFEIASHVLIGRCGQKFVLKAIVLIESRSVSMSTLSNRHVLNLSTKRARAASSAG